MIGVVRNEALAGKIIQGAWAYNEKLKGVGFSVLENTTSHALVAALAA